MKDFLNKLILLTLVAVTLNTFVSPTDYFAEMAEEMVELEESSEEESKKESEESSEKDSLLYTIFDNQKQHIQSLLRHAENALNEDVVIEISTPPPRQIS